MRPWIALRDAPWLTGSRVRGYSLIIAVLLLIAAGVVIKARLDGAAHDPAGRPPASDFDAFYAAGSMANMGLAPQIYDLPALSAAERRIMVVNGGSLPFLYPPPILLLCGPVARLPVGLAWVMFEVAGLVPLLLFLKMLLPRGVAFLPVAAAPAVWMNFGSGQTGFLTAAAFAGGAALVSARPMLGGAILGLLVIKPSLALLIPVSLAAARRWRALAACAAAAALLCVVSWGVFGTAAWRGFFAQAPLARDMIEHWPASYAVMMSPFAAARMAAGIGAGAAAQALFAAAAVAMVLASARRRPGGAAEIALLAATAPAATPYLMDYDLVCLGVPAVWLAGVAQGNGWLAWEKLTLAMLYILPLLARAVQLGFHLPLAVLVMTALAVLVFRRTRLPA